jgi:hypothetical protein
MAVLTTFTSATSGPDAMDTLNSVLAQILALKAAVVPTIVAVAASGTTQTLTGAAGVGSTYDVTLTGNCAFTLAAATGGIYPQLVTLYLRQDATAGRTATFSGIAWASGSAPQLNTSGGAYDVLQLATLDGVKWLGSVLALGVVAPAVPAAPTLTVTPGNASNVLTFIDGAANGSPITSRKLYRGTTAGGETLLGTITLTNGSYTDTGLTNGTTYYYRASTVNAIGEGLQSAEVSATPQALHYLNNSVSGGRATSPADTTNSAFFDLIVPLQYAAFPTGDGPIAGYYNGSSSNKDAYLYFRGSTNHLAGIVYAGTTAKFPEATSAIPASALGAKLWVRMIVNSTTAAVTEGGGTWGARTITFMYSVDGTNWTSLGYTSINYDVTGGTGASIGAGGPDRVYGLTMRDASGTVLYNPDFTAQATGATSFTDSAGKVWTVPAGMLS